MLSSRDDVAIEDDVAIDVKRCGCFGRVGWVYYDASEVRFHRYACVDISTVGVILMLLACKSIYETYMIDR